MNRLVLVGTAALLSTPIAAQQSGTKPAPVKRSVLGATTNVHKIGSLYVAGQPQQDDIKQIAKRGIKRVITLRSKREVKWDEDGLVREAGMEFIRIPVTRPDRIADEQFDRVRSLLRESGPKPTLLHCGAATRVAAMWIPFRILDEGVDRETAIKESQQIGLSGGSLLSRALAYVDTHSQEKSVRPGINDRYLAKDLKVAEWVDRFEGESREVYSQRFVVLKACGLKKGMRVADIGSGTGLYTRLFSQAVGDEGWVFAVDIAPAFLQHINRKMATTGTNNVTGVLAAEDSVRLPPGSLDFAFICDTYHHFEYPRSTMKSLHRAMKPDATLVVIDFERIEGKSRPFVMGHVRAGKDVFQKEIEAAGFEKIEEVRIRGFQENYFLKFRRK